MTGLCGNFTDNVNGIVTAGNDYFQRSKYRTMLNNVLVRIEQRLAALHLSASKASLLSGLSSDGIRNLRRAVKSGERSGASIKTLEALAPVLGVTSSWLIDGTDDAQSNLEAQSAHQALPVYGLAAGAITGAHTRSNDPVEYVACPPGLNTVRDAYALIVVGSSMEPRYFTGELVYINPHRPVRGGDHVVIQENRDNGIQVSIKLFEKYTDQNVVTRQYNPPSEIKFLRSRVLHVHRVMTINELMGL